MQMKLTAPVRGTQIGTHVMTNDFAFGNYTNHLNTFFISVRVPGTEGVGPSEMKGWMYGCVFTDLDGHKWNVLYMDLPAGRQA